MPLCTGKTRRNGLANPVSAPLVTAGDRPHSNKREAHAVLAVRRSSRSILSARTKTKRIAIWQRRYVLPVSTGFAISGRPLH
jgi:hypothetical protein